MGRGHVKRGAMMVSRVAQRMHLPAQDESLSISWWIVMSCCPMRAVCVIFPTQF